MLTNAVQTHVFVSCSAQIVVPLVNFQAVLDSSVFRYYKTNDNVVFKEVMTNDGGGYDPVTGFFTTPVTVVYIFTVHYCPFDYSEAGFEIVQEGRPLRRSAHKSESKFKLFANMQVVANVEKGARVWMRATYKSCIKMDAIGSNSFVGLLIHAIEN